MVNFWLDGHHLEVPGGTTLLEAAQHNGIEVPVFCYHPELSVGGNCRVCLMEVVGMAKPVASCATVVREGMVAFSQTPAVREDRAGVLELLLINHPLDCPICDQAGECDLQDLSIAYGQDRSRFTFPKRTVPQIYLGPLIKPVMTRCIHCTLCVRFAREVGGVAELGALKRGEEMEIASYLERAVTSELSGNLIDLCPVGALNAAPSAFRARSWELAQTPSIDVLDGVGSAIRIDTYKGEVVRILPRPSPSTNGSWIDDKTRFSLDGLKIQRLDRPYVRTPEGRLKEASWQEAFEVIEKNLRPLAPSEKAGLAGDLVELESLSLFQDLMKAWGTPFVECRQVGSPVRLHSRAHYTFNSSFDGLDVADFILLVGTNPRLEAPVLNARIRKNYEKCGVQVAVLGPGQELTYPVVFQDNRPQILEEILAGDHCVAAMMTQAQRPMIILGAHTLTRPDAGALLALWGQIGEKYGCVTPEWCGLNVLHTSAVRVGALDLGLLPANDSVTSETILAKCKTGEIRAIYLLGADEIPTSSLADTFVIYQGHHGDTSASIADVILPGAAYTEKPGLYVNSEGRLQEAQPACLPPGVARQDWQILRDLLNMLGVQDVPQTLSEVRRRVGVKNPCLSKIGEVVKTPWTSVPLSDIPLSDQPFEEAVVNFYMTNVISRHSPTMAACVRERASFGKRREGRGG